MAVASIFLQLSVADKLLALRDDRRKIQQHIGDAIQCFLIVNRCDFYMPTIRRDPHARRISSMQGVLSSLCSGGYRGYLTGRKTDG
ncbi:hypothetical protein GLE_1862 [Lysobacter enzymogenes]|uniref:Uncharacterized protein n=1 Tax=Lysobacter enzymogenes TaxID=69 RepID=A0A0S2DFT7_LYSEN|nr:hypothetical protein GLE_1862 [Lysobacter enzymogenes]